MENNFENNIYSNSLEIEPGELEEKTHELLELLPDTPKKQNLLKQTDEADDAQLKKIYSEARVIFEKIQETKRTPFADYPEEEDFSDLEEDCEDLREIVKSRARQVVREALENKMIHLGSGYTAGVFASKTCPEYCYKIILNPKEYKKGKNVKEEIAFMDMLSDLEVDGVRIPKPVCYRMNKEAHIMVMETFDALTINELKSLDDLEGVVENFDYERFFAALEKYIKAMHTRGVHHRDLHDKNIMIDKKTGVPRVIDFGKSTKTGLINSEEIYSDTSVRGTVRYTSDEEYLKQHRSALLKFKNKE